MTGLIWKLRVVGFVYGLKGLMMAVVPAPIGAAAHG